jgi:hypothetical protein
VSSLVDFQIPARHLSRDVYSEMDRQACTPERSGQERKQLCPLHTGMQALGEERDLLGKRNIKEKRQEVEQTPGSTESVCQGLGRGVEGRDGGDVVKMNRVQMDERSNLQCSVAQ